MSEKNAKNNYEPFIWDCKINVCASRMFSKDTELYHKQLFEIGKKGDVIINIIIVFFSVTRLNGQN